MELHESLYALGQAFGNQVFEDPESFRGALDDFLDEGAASTGDINLLADAVRLGAYRRMREMLASGATPVAAVDAAGELLARERGSADVAGSRWACAVLGYATGRISGTQVQEYRTSPTASPGAAATDGGGSGTPTDDWLGPSTQQVAQPSHEPTQEESTRVGTAGSSAPPAPRASPAGRGTAPPATGPAPDAPAPEYAEPFYTPPEPRRRSRWPLLVVGIVVVLAVIGAVAWFSLGNDQKQASGSTTGTSSTGGPTDKSSGGATKGVTCWNGKQAAQPSACSVPKGLKGLRWVFPSFDRDFDKCYLRPVRNADPVTRPIRSWFCPSKPGSLAGTSYTEWPNHSVDVTKYDREYPTPPATFDIAGRHVGYRWRLKSPLTNGLSKGLYKVTFVYHHPPGTGGQPSWPFGTSVYGATPTARDDTCAQLILRAPHDFTKAAPPCS